MIGQLRERIRETLKSRGIQNCDVRVARDCRNADFVALCRGLFDSISRVDFFLVYDFRLSVCLFFRLSVLIINLKAHYSELIK